MKVMDFEQVKRIEKRLRLIMEKTYPLCEWPMEDIAIVARDCNSLAHEAFKIIEHHQRGKEESDHVAIYDEPTVFRPSETDAIEARKRKQKENEEGRS